MTTSICRLSVAGSTEGSVAMWIKTSIDVTTGAAHLFYVTSQTGGNGGGSEQELHLNLLNDERLQFFIEGGSQDVSVVSGTSLSGSGWHHVAATWDINGDAILYIDGVPVGSQPHTADSFPESATIRLGRPSASTRYYQGLMDDVRLFDAAIGADAVYNLYSRGLTQSCWPSATGRAAQSRRRCCPPVEHIGIHRMENVR